MQEKKLIFLSAGGTGGHVLPAAALSDDLRARGFATALVTDMRGKKYAPSFGGIPVYVIAAGTLGAGLAGKLKGIAGLALGIAQAFALLAKIKPAIVVGFGGYPSFPAVFAAQIMGVPTIIHEQNAVVGKANAMLAPRAKKVALSLPGGNYKNAVVTGNPVRAEIAALGARPYPPAGEPLKIFVMGGSLGAKVFSSVVPGALAQLPAASIEVVQQCKAEDIEAVRAAYAKAGIKARLESFFTDVADILAASHLVISRSGASTVAEVAAAGRPAIFVPYPHHGDMQQLANARLIAEAGGAWVMEEKSGFTPDALLAKMREFLNNPGLLREAAQKARSCGRPDAARHLGDVVAGIVK